MQPSRLTQGGSVPGRERSDKPERARRPARGLGRQPDSAAGAGAIRIAGFAATEGPCISNGSRYRKLSIGAGSPAASFDCLGVIMIRDESRDPADMLFINC